MPKNYELQAQLDKAKDLIEHLVVVASGLGRDAGFDPDDVGLKNNKTGETMTLTELLDESVAFCGPDKFPDWKPKAERDEEAAVHGELEKLIRSLIEGEAKIEAAETKSPFILDTEVKSLLATACGALVGLTDTAGVDTRKATVLSKITGDTVTLQELLDRAYDELTSKGQVEVSAAA